MKFEFGGRQFRINFERRKKLVTYFERGKEKHVNSKYPYTTVTLYELRPTGTPYATVLAHATVGCLHTDKFSNVAGHKFALKVLCRDLKRHNQPTEFRRAIWEAYNNRAKQPVKTEVIETTAERVTEQKALPTAQTVADANKLDERTIH